MDSIEFSWSVIDYLPNVLDLNKTKYIPGRFLYQKSDWDLCYCSQDSFPAYWIHSVTIM